MNNNNNKDIVIPGAIPVVYKVTKAVLVTTFSLLFKPKTIIKKETINKIEEVTNKVVTKSRVLITKVKGGIETIVNKKEVETK